MKIQLSDHFSYRKLVRFTLPSIGMMIFMSIYGVVDGKSREYYIDGTLGDVVIYSCIMLGRRE